MQETSLDNFHIVLVEPANSLNVGSVARAMMNLGFRHLHLVAPIDFDADRATVTARNATVLIESARIHTTLAEAVADCEDVVGFSLRPGKSHAHFALLPEWSQALSENAPRKTALVFGPEDNGLRHEHLYACRWIVRIPASVEFPEFNLAQSVLLVLYEVYRVTHSTAEESASPANLAAWNDYYQLDRMLDTVMDTTGFVRPGSPAPGPDRVKSLMRRLELTPDEIRLFLALFGRIQLTLEREGRDR